MEPNKDETNYNWQYSIKSGDILLHEDTNLVTNEIEIINVSKYVVESMMIKKCLIYHYPIHCQHL